MLRSSGWPCLLLLGTLAACSGTEGSQAVLAPRASVVDSQTQALLSEVTSDGDLRFAGSTPQLEKFASGDVLILGVGTATPYGALREVTGVRSEGAGVIVSSKQARLQDAFERLRFTAEDTLAPEDATSGLLPSQAGKGFSFPFAFSARGKDGRADLVGSLALEPKLEFKLDLDLAAFELDELSLHFGAAETLDARLTGQGSLTVNEGVTVATVPFTPIVLTLPTPVGPVPIVLTPQMVVGVGLEGAVSGGFAASVLQQASVEASVGYKDGDFGGTSRHDERYTADTPTYQANMNLSAFGGPRFEILLYGAVGPFAEAEGTLELSAQSGGPPPCLSWDLRGGLRARAGIDFIVDVKADLFEISRSLVAYDGCGGDPNNPPPLPVSTWARSFARVGSGGENARAIAEVSSGGYVVAGDSGLFGGVTGVFASVWVLRLDPEGRVMWQRAFGEFQAGGSVKAVAEVPGGFLVVAGSSMLRLDLAGNLLWARRYGVGDGQGLDLRSAVALPDGSLIAAGAGGPVGAMNAWAMRVDAEGKVLWSHRLGGDLAHGVRLLSNGDVLLVGRRAGATTQGWLVRLDANGSLVWARAISQRYDDNGDDPGGVILDAVSEVFDAVETSSGLQLVGDTYGGFRLPASSVGGFFAAWMVDLSSSGEVTRSTVFRALPASEVTSLYAVASRADGPPLILGESFESGGTSGRDVLLLQGATARILGTPDDDIAYFPDAEGGGRPLVATRDEGFALAVTSSGLGGPRQVWVLKLGRTADVPLTGSAHLVPVTGFSFQNPHVTSSPAAGLVPTPLSISTTVITSQVKAESTPIHEGRQSP